MTNISRRVRKLESALSPAETAQDLRLEARLEAARKRLEEYEAAEPGRVRLQIPQAYRAMREYSCLAGRLQFAQARISRQWLFDEYQAVSNDLDEAASDEKRSRAEMRVQELQRNYERHGFASAAGFLQNCREEGWLPVGILLSTHRSNDRRFFVHNRVFLP